ncbi:MAG: hypothetical protein MUE51_15055, partial [Thermoleophilia bacterium]|nr:hypothetical protein [Thermoleophilia bacterium]
MAAPTTLTLAEAALVLGTTKKALERRAERGTLRVHRAGGVRMVDAGELLRAGLARLAPAGPAAPAGAATGALMHRL